MSAAPQTRGRERVTPPPGVVTLAAAAPPVRATIGSLRGLDWLNFFVANVQTGFGPFLAVYLTAQGWTQTHIGLLLTVSGAMGLAGQMPGGALVDWARSPQPLARFAIIAIAASAVLIALQPNFAAVLGAQVLHVGASCVLGPAIAALSLGLVGHAALGERLGRNASFAAIGSGLAAALMGGIGWLSTGAVFYVTAALAIPALVTLSWIRESEVDSRAAHGGVPDPRDESSHVSLRQILTNKPLLIFCVCILFFHFANAAMLPLMAGIVTMRSSQWASVLIAACIVAPQIMVAVASPWVGRKAQLWGRRGLLLLGFVGLPLRAALFAFVSDPYVLVAVQILDGLSGAALGVLVPLIVADVTRGTGHFNLALGIVGTATGIGGSLSTGFAGYMADTFGSAVAFLSLGLVALMGLLLVWLHLPETRPEPAELAADLSPET